MVNETNDKIRYTSFKFFLEKGYEATNIRDICKIVKIKPSSLYFYYKSKQELFFSIYDEICSEKINYMNGINELKSNISPDLKFEILYKQIIEYYIRNILNEKFLLRYHLFPTEEISLELKDRFRFWNNEEDKIILNIINECLQEGIITIDRSACEYLYIYRRFLLYQLTDMLIYNIKKNLQEQDKVWESFWNQFTYN